MFPRLLKLMARHNDVRLYGCIADTPRITKDNETGTPKRAVFHLAVIKSQRDTGEEDGGKIKYDWPMIITSDPEQIAEIMKCRLYDLVEVQGVLTERKIKKGSYCPTCGKINWVEGNAYYVTPLFLKKRTIQEKELTEKQAILNVRENRAISNNIALIANLCMDVNYYHKGNICTSLYQAASDRKVFIKEDDPNKKADFFWIRTFGKMAKNDQEAIHKGSTIFVEGYLHTREFTRKTTCQAEDCRETYEWKDNIIEVIPYSCDYIAGYDDPETIERKKTEEAASIEQSILSRKA